MRKTMNKAVGLALAVTVGALAPLAINGDSNPALAGDHRYKNSAPHYNPNHQSVVRITNSDDLPINKGIKLGKNKSVLVELPHELRDVVVSNPDIMDAVVQSSNRVYLIGKKVGQSNAFFFDSHGEQILTLEVSIEHDVTVLDALYRRLLADSLAGRPVRTLLIWTAEPKIMEVPDVLLDKALAARGLGDAIAVTGA